MSSNITIADVSLAPSGAADNLVAQNAIIAQYEGMSSGENAAEMAEANFSDAGRVSGAFSG